MALVYPATGGGSGGGTVKSVTATDTSVVVAGTATDPTVATGTLDVIAADHPPAADWSNNSKKITSLANGAAASDAAAFGQIPTALPPNGAAGGDLAGSTYPNPTIAAVAVTTGKLAAGAVTEAKQTLADNTTANVSASAHGYMPKLPNDATKICDGTGAYTQTGWTIVTKGSDQSVTSSTTVIADTALQFAAASSAVYEVEAVLIFGSPVGGGTPDLKLSAGEDTTSRGVLGVVAYSTTDAATTTAMEAKTTAGAITIGTATNDRAAIVKGTYIGGGGTFAIYWAQANSNVNAVTMRTGSLLRYRRVL